MPYTPGPWKIGLADEQSEGHVLYTKERTVAWTCNSYNDKTGEDFISKEDHCNAKLIALAPRMADLLMYLASYDLDLQDMSQHAAAEVRAITKRLQQIA